MKTFVFQLYKHNVVTTVPYFWFL